MMKIYFFTFRVFCHARALGISCECGCALNRCLARVLCGSVEADTRALIRG